MKKELIEKSKMLNGYYLHRTFKVKYLGPTDTRGSRVKIIDCNFEKTVILSSEAEFYNVAEQAIYYLLEKGFDVQGVVSGDTQMTTIICCKWTGQKLD